MIKIYKTILEISHSYFSLINFVYYPMEEKLDWAALLQDMNIFFEWLRLSEDDKVNRKSIEKEGTSIEYLLDGLFDHETLLDYIENFILYENKREKIIAKKTINS